MGDIGKETQFDIGQLLFYIYFIPQIVKGGDKSHCNVTGQYQGDEIKQPGQWRFPERGKDFDFQRTHIIHPHAVSVCRADAKPVSTRREVRIGNRALIARLFPFFVEAFQLISIRNTGRMRHFQGCIAEGEIVLVMRNFNTFHVFQILW